MLDRLVFRHTDVLHQCFLVFLICGGETGLDIFFPGNVKPCLSVKNDKKYSLFFVI